MNMDQFIIEKEELQKKISEESGYDIHVHAKQTHETVLKLAEEYHVQLKWTDNPGGHTDTNEEDEHNPI